MRRIAVTALTLFATFATAMANETPPEKRAQAVAGASACLAKDGGLGTDRIVEIDTASGPLFGDITRQDKEATFLKPKEVVLTFDDGPMPWVTRSILDTLDQYCTKATFFSVGRMALAYPQTLRDVLARGHTLGGHTWSHPLNLKRLKPEKAIDEIERGFAALSIASGGRTSPFFRFPGLSDNGAMLAALQNRGIAAFSVDVVSDDSYISDPARLARVTIDRVEARRGGILLFHDIKTATAKALPTILTELKKRGYKVVHMRSKELLKPLPELAGELQPLLVKSDPPRGPGAERAAMLPFYGALGPVAAKSEPEGDKVAALDIAVEQVAPQPRERKIEAVKDPKSATSAKPKHAGRTKLDLSYPEGWSTNVRRARLNRAVYD